METNLNRYWVSWYTPNNEEVETSFIYSRNSSLEEENLEILSAVIDADSKNDVWKGIKKFFPDFTERFIQERQIEWLPGHRFPEFKAKRTTIKELKEQKYDVYGQISVKKYLGSVEAKSENQAEIKANELKNSINFCKKCSKDIKELNVVDINIIEC